jgi:hypothetical protein
MANSEHLKWQIEELIKLVAALTKRVGELENKVEQLLPGLR